MTFLVWRIDEKTGKRYGPYAVRSVRVQGCETPRQEYLGKVVVKEDGTVELKRTKEILGRLGEKNGDVVKVSPLSNVVKVGQPPTTEGEGLSLEEDQKNKPIKTVEDLAVVFAKEMKKD